MLAAILGLTCSQFLGALRPGGSFGGFQPPHKAVFVYKPDNSGAYRGANDGRYTPDNSGAYNNNDGKYHPDNAGAYVHNDDKYKHQDDKYKHQADKFGNGGNNNGGNGGFGNGGNGGQYNGGSGTGFGTGSNVNSGAGANGGSTILSAGDVYGKPQNPGKQPHPNKPGKLPGKPNIPGKVPGHFSNNGNQFASGNGFGDKYENNQYRILKKVEKVEQDGYHYLYETENGIEAEEQGKLANVGTDDEGMRAHGFYTYTGPDNVVYTVRYTADENGFVPEGAHIPTPPPIPAAILRALEYQRAAGTL